MFLEKYGYKALWYGVVLFITVGIPIWIVYFFMSYGVLTPIEAASWWLSI